MTTTRFVRAPELDIPVCQGCGDPGFPTQAWLDTRSGQVFRTPVGEIPADFDIDDDDDVDPPFENVPRQFDSIPLILPCCPWPPADEDFAALDRVSPEADYF